LAKSGEYLPLNFLFIVLFYILKNLLSFRESNRSFRKCTKVSVFGSVVPIGSFSAFDVEADVGGFVAIGSDFPASQADVGVDSLFNDAVKLEGKKSIDA